MTPSGSHNYSGTNGDVQPLWGWVNDFIRFANEVEPLWGSFEIDFFQMIN